MDEAGITRRSLLAQGALAGSALALGRLAGPLTAAPAASGVVPLPSPADVRRDFQRMVDFGPRLTGTDAHNAFLDWLEREFVAAGLDLLPCDELTMTRWEAQSYGLDVGGSPVRVASYYPRSQETPPGGLEGPLVYGGTAPAPSLNSTGGSIAAGLAAYPGQLASFAEALPSTVGSVDGSILLVDVPMPAPLTAGFLVGLATFLYWKGHSEADWLSEDYKRAWILPGVSGIPLEPFRQRGVKGVVFILDASLPAIDGGYMPFENAFEKIPALFVDRDTGAALRARAATRPQARLTLTATRAKVPTRSVTAVLPGQSDETLILDSHTDGEGFVEENGPVALVQMARHFASLPPDKRLKRTLVFGCWPGHMAPDMPQLEGWIDSHKELVDKAAAALTIEHLGCTEWVDSPDRGYHATGEAEPLGVWTTQGRMFELTRDTVVANDVPHVALLRPPVQFGVGGAFQSHGVPQIGAIAGPAYLLTINSTGDMEKLDEALAARQIRWLADLTTKLDPVPAAELRTGDPTLGDRGGEASQKAREVACGPSGAGSGAGPVRMKVSLSRRGRRARLRRLRGRLSLNRAGNVNMRAVVRRGRRSRLVSRGVVRMRGAGRRRFSLRLTRRGRSLLRRPGRARISLTARYRRPGARTVIARARRVLRR